ncbi:hypothetical protein A3J19_02365 [Candidatus Daviesbacteria bacterium RIFCSPLOWO2_02_FULL_41_8]|uniref:Polysaccharide biosynthesis protein C-terminal domain-containing protein n=2 Tax=Candidatus Daviesiibacteriota TaxID=1752718 RepID=A0A1F5NIR3_9BACT|nr:MAG: hypothetical protein A3D83_01155 [Candidatus Daviesbacteria bacterium RIFCSPHIGHO2_02_FULL_41_10]OGE77444.1 MAG: hypothetical protein A3J19_02365 [Candidatus Daviesbacteria bacterium RIFCSPLOWO2_02_FULL_41_8]
MKISNLKFTISNFIKNPLFSGSAVMIVGSNAVSFINYLYHLMMGRLLGPANYGELVAIISLIGLLGVIPGSLNLVVIKYISSAKNDMEISSLINWFKNKIIIASLVFCLILLILSPVISSFLHLSKSYYLILMALFFFFSIQSLLNRSILQGLLKFKEMIASVLVENGIRLLAGILLVYLGFAVGGAIAGFAISVVLGWYITVYCLHYNELLRSKLQSIPSGNFFSNHLFPHQWWEVFWFKNKTKTEIKVDLKDLLRFTIPVMVQSIAITSLYSSDVILVKHFFETKEAGIYAALSNLGKIIFFGAGPISAVMFPLVSQRRAKGERHKRIFIYSFFATITLAIAILLVYWLFPQLAIRLLYGELFLGASYLLVWFGIFISFFTLSTLLVSYSLSVGRTSVVIFPLIGAVAQIIGIWFFHISLFEVVLVSCIVTGVLLALLLIYSAYGSKVGVGDRAGLQTGKDNSKRPYKNKRNFG